MDKAMLQERYGKSERGNFWVEDTIGVPHPFCITPAHIAAAQDFGGKLGTPAIEALERRTGRPSCGVRGCNLFFDKHEQAVLVACKLDIKDQKDGSELHRYLLDCKERAEKDGYAGFAFIRAQDLR
jgi:hypothetical protein